MTGPLPPQSVLTRHIDTGIAIHGYTADQMRAYASQEVAAERERCAKLVESMDVSGHDGYIETSGDLLEALAGCIRRGGVE